MAGSLLLEGGSEFQGAMAEADRAALSLVGREDAHICILPTAAAYDNNHINAGNNGVRWFASLGFKNVQVINVIDKNSADEPFNATQIESADIIFILGGFPHYLACTLGTSRCSQALHQAYSKGKIICGSSAGAMVLCDHYFNPEDGEIYQGLGLLSGTLIIPHHEKFGRGWLEKMQRYKQSTILGIDEQTGILWHKTKSTWRVYGSGNVTVYQTQGVKHMVVKHIIGRGEEFTF